MMHTPLQPGVRSRRASNGVSAVPHSKSDAVNAKLKKRDKSGDSSKQERSIKLDDGPSYKIEEQFEVVAGKEGGLSILTSVDKLVHVMQQERSECWTVDNMSHRMSLVGILAATENEDCLARFVQLGGLPVLDDWLQEVHKGKTDAAGLMEGLYDELTLNLLYALDKLPVDLDALKTCMVGKSVNNLRTHKNLEVQKKARKLVETWKKRVDAEMKVLDEAWSNKYPTLRSRTQLAKGHSTSPRDLQNSGKHKKSYNERGISTTFSEKDTSDSGAPDEIFNHQRIIVRLPNPARSPIRKSVTSRTSSLSSDEKQDVSNVKGKNTAQSPDSCGDVKSGSPDADNSVSGPVVGYDPRSTCQSNSHCDNAFDSTSVDAARDKCCDANSDAGTSSLANMAGCDSIQPYDSASLDKECTLGKGVEMAVEAVQLSQAKMMEDQIHLSEEQVLDEKVQMGSPLEGLTGSASEMCQGCAAGSVEDAKGSSEESQRSLDNDLKEDSLGDHNSIGPSSLSPSRNVVAKSREPIRGCNVDDDALVVALQVAMEVEQEINVTINADSSSFCKSELPLDNATDENPPTKANGKALEQERSSAHLTSVHASFEGEFLQDVVDTSNKAVALAASSVEEGGGDDGSAGNDSSKRHFFDLNEGIMTEESLQEPPLLSAVSLMNQTQVSAFSGSLAAPVSVVTATKGPFIPSSDLLKCRVGELNGWKGSAATSAFRPAEPRHLASESFQCLADARGKRARILDIDLNVADESEDIMTSSRMGLDLNKTGENEEWLGRTYGQNTASAMQVRDFDLNDGLDVEGSVEQELSQSKPSIFSSLPQLPANSIVLPSASGTDPSLPLEAFPILKTPSIHVSPCNNDTYRSGVALSCTYPFASSVPSVLPYDGFPFVSGFSYNSAAFGLSSMPASSSSVVIPPFAAAPSPATTATAPYVRPYLMGVSELPAAGNSGSYWPRPGLDLNGEDGSGGFCVSPVNQLSFQPGGPVKRKEPEPYFDPFRSGCRQLA